MTSGRYRADAEPANVRRMTKRLLAGGLWALAVYSAAEVFTGLAGVADPLGLVFGLAVGSLIAWDPSGRIWSAPPRRRKAVIPAGAAPADAQSVSAAR